MSLLKTYFKKMKQGNGYRATWMPNLKISIGDVGTLNQGRFSPFSNLSKMDIDFEVEIGEDEVDYDFESEGDVDIMKKLSGALPALEQSALGEADAGFTIKFKNEHAIVFKLAGAKPHRIANAQNLGNQLKALKQQGKWERNWVVVTEVVEADSGTILISKTGSFHLDIKVNAEIGTEDFKLSDGKLEILNNSNNKRVINVNGNHMTPLYNVSGFKLFGGFGPKGLVTIDDPLTEAAEEGFGSLSITDDYIDNIEDDY